MISPCTFERFTINYVKMKALLCLFLSLALLFATVLPGVAQVTQPPGTYQESPVLSAPRDLSKGSPEGARIIVLGGSYKLTPEEAAAATDLKYTEQVQMMKKLLLQKPDARISAIEDAFREVYGRSSSAAEAATWDARMLKEKSWYAVMVSQLSNEMNSNSAEKKTVTSRVFQDAYGRLPTAAEAAKYENDKQHYRISKQGLITYMYSENGVNELLETIKRSFAGKSASDADVKTRLLAAKQKLMDFNTIVATFQPSAAVSTDVFRQERRNK